MVQFDNKKYIKGLDRLRVLALFGVFFYHLIEYIVPSGYHGVSIFFVLAGFLSMNVIAYREYSVSIKESINKIIDKIKKLIPPLVLVVTIVSIVMFFCFKGFLKSYPIDVLSSILPFSNYAQILKNESYFDAMNSMKPLTHIWALSLEMQFYIIFFLIIYKFYKKELKNKFLIVFLVLYVISVALGFILCFKNANLTRIYYGFDTRINAFLLGMITSIILVKDDIYVIQNETPKIIKIFIFILLVVLMFVKLDTDIKTIIGITIYSVLCAVLIYFICKDEMAGYSIFSNECVHVIVKRSYIVYLVHYPLIIFVNRFLAHIRINYVLYVLIVILLTIIITELLYRILKICGVKVLFLLLIDILICIYAVYGKYETAYVYESHKVEETTVKTDVATESKVLIDADSIDVKEKFVPNENAEIDYNNSVMSSAVERVRLVNQNVGGIASISVKDFLKYYHMKITLIGDSVSECAHGALSVYFPTSYINAEGNRQIRKAEKIFDEMKKNGELGDVVVIALGTNSDKDIEVDVLEKIYYETEGRPMVVLTVITPYMTEEGRRNKALTEFVRSHENCYLGDWYTAMKTHYEYFMGDDTHPKGLGCDAFAQVIYKAAVDALSGNKKDKIDSKKYEYLEKAEVKDIVTYGSYYIKNDSEKEKIEWIVLDKDEKAHTLLLLSKYALDCKKYNLSYEPINWGKSLVRSWLNEKFYDTAFNDEEKAFIKNVNLYNKKNPIYETFESPETKDNVFILSYEEATKYLDKNLLKCKGTEYFISQNGYVNDEEIYKGNCDWWLRTPGDANTNVMNVSSEGEIIMSGDFSTTDDFGVRPAIYVRYE